MGDTWGVFRQSNDEYLCVNFAVEGAQQFPSGKGHLSEVNVILYWSFAKGTTAKAQGLWQLEHFER